MNISNTLQQLRKRIGLTQDEFAEKLFVTRQAVSRWENGETTPTIDTIKRITEIFGADANELMGITPLEKTCISCGMPMKELKDFAAKDTDKDYCRYCANEDGNLKSYEEILAASIPFAMNEYNMSREVAEIETPKYLKTLPAWKNLK